MNDLPLSAAGDLETARAFSTSWLNLPEGSIYTPEQVTDWLYPITPDQVAGKSLLELGCGNGSLLVHLVGWGPKRVVGVDLGDSVESARANMRGTGFQAWDVHQRDLIGFVGDDQFDVVISIGVLHHLQTPEEGFAAVLANTKSGGRFHCWVYGKEGNALVRAIVDPMRRLFRSAPWWVTKHAVATPLALPVYVYAKLVRILRKQRAVLRWLPLADYMTWLGRREIAFVRHVIFDQLVAPTTHYLAKAEIEAWLTRADRVDPNSSYLLSRNGNSWKFGGSVR